MTESVALTPLDRVEEVRLLYGRARDAEFRAQVDADDAEAAEELAAIEAAIEAADVRRLANELRQERAAIDAKYEHALDIVTLPRPRPRTIDVDEAQKQKNERRNQRLRPRRRLPPWRPHLSHTHLLGRRAFVDA